MAYHGHLGDTYPINVIKMESKIKEEHDTIEEYLRCDCCCFEIPSNNLRRLRELVGIE